MVMKLKEGVRGVSCCADEEFRTTIASVRKCSARFLWVFSTGGKGTMPWLLLLTFSCYGGLIVRRPRPTSCGRELTRKIEGGTIFSRKGKKLLLLLLPC